MASQGLSREQCRLLQQHHDGELSAAQSVQATQMLERSATARVYLKALDELSHATRAASELAWEQAKDAAQSPAVLAELAANAGDLAKAPLADLAAQLERFHDGEVDEAEMAFISALLDERDDAVDYLASLDEIGQGMRVVGEEISADVDFDGFWDGIASQIKANEPEATPSTLFDRREHLVLLHRYVDGEVTSAEQALVDGWIKSGDRDVSKYFEVLTELSLGVNAALDVACEQAELRDIWTGVQARINDDGVVSLADRRAQKPDTSSGAGRPSESGGPSWVGEYRQAIVGGLAAAVVLAGLVGLFKDQIFAPQERVIVEKRVVIVEQVEYSPGSDVMIDSPMKQVSAGSDGDEDSTVIWLFDSDSEPNGDPSSDEAGGDAPKEQGQDEQDQAEQDQDTGNLDEDAGRKSAPKGQPI
jgi:hypothetical protein